MALNRRVTIVGALVLLAMPVATVAAETTGGIATSVYSQYLWRGRDYTYASAPVATVSARVHNAPVVSAPILDDLRLEANLTTINALWNRGAPFEAAMADTVRLAGSAAGTFFGSDSAGGWLGVEIGINVSLFYGAMIAQGGGYGSLMLEPFVSIGLPAVDGAPRWSALFDVTPDQVGWRGGVEWFPTFNAPWGTVTGYLGIFRPHNYLKQKSDSVLGRLFEGEPGLALVALIPSDLTVGASSWIPISAQFALQPELELLVIPNRAQNPRQIVPAAALTLFYGGPAAAPTVHDGR